MTITTIGIKHFIFAFCIFLWASGKNEVMSITLHESYVAEVHEKWMSQYGRSYTNEKEKEKRFNIFKENMEFIENFNNSENKTYELGLNQFADLTIEEFIASHAGFQIPSHTPLSSKVESVASLNLTNIPSYIDWREYGAVTNVKYQGFCDSCSIFSAVAAMEGIVKIKTGNLISLSEQQLVDCSIQGCYKGIMQNVYTYIIQNRGIASENDYPYRGFVERCQEATPLAQISGFRNVARNSEEQLLLAVANQPVSVAIAINQYFRFYRRGIFSGPCGTYLNHAVVAIGYGTSNVGNKYWLIKNSWGSNWGVDGYMFLLRENGQPEGLCGIAMDPSFPII